MTFPPSVFAGLEITELGPWRLVHWWLLASTLAAAGWVLFGGQHRGIWADRAVAWWAFHWFTGGPLEPHQAARPEPGTRAAWLCRRVAIGTARTALAGTVVAAEYIRSGAPSGTGPRAVVVAGVGGALALSGTAWLTAHAAIRTAHYFQWKLPLHRAVCAPAGWDPKKKRPSRYIKVRRDRAEGRDGPVMRWLRGHVRVLQDFGGKSGVIVKMHPSFKGTGTSKAGLNAREQVLEVVRAKLELGDVQETWVPTGRHMYLQVRPREPIPTSAMFVDDAVRQLVEDYAYKLPVIGLSRGGRPVELPLETDSPHFLVSASTGRGKSAILRTVAAQLMHNGAELGVIDWKRHSQRWARPLPTVRYARDEEEIHDALVTTGRIAAYRNRYLDNYDIDDDDPTFRRLVLVCEELNGTMSVLTQWWKDNRHWKWTGDSRPPDTSPAITALRQVLFMGRAVRIHVLAIAQYATANSLGGTEARKNYGTRYVSRHTKSEWNMLTEAEWRPPTTTTGRGYVCLGPDAVETQVIYMTEHEARAWALSGRGSDPAIDVASVASSETTSLLGERLASVASAANTEALYGVQPVTLKEASSDEGEGIVTLRHGALRRCQQLAAKGLDPEFPAPVDPKAFPRRWSPTALQMWERNRERSRIPVR